MACMMLMRYDGLVWELPAWSNGDRAVYHRGLTNRRCFSEFAKLRSRRSIAT